MLSPDLDGPADSADSPETGGAHVEAGLDPGGMGSFPEGREAGAVVKQAHAQPFQVEGTEPQAPLDLIYGLTVLDVPYEAPADKAGLDEGPDRPEVVGLEAQCQGFGRGTRREAPARGRART